MPVRRASTGLRGSGQERPAPARYHPDVDYLDFLQRLHSVLEPRRYLEIGVRWGNSLSLARCPSIGVDPSFNISHELHTEVHLFRTTSDEYFSRPSPMAPLGDEPLDLVFIDGLHLFEFALRDFMHVERHCRPGALVVFDDILPRNVGEASRVPGKGGWTGDVYSIVTVLQRYRPDILMLQVDTTPTGLLLLAGLDPASTTLADHYEEIVAEHRRPDPQPVPAAALGRRDVLPPAHVLSSGVLELLAATPDDVDRVELAARLRETAARRLGPAFALRVGV